MRIKPPWAGLFLLVTLLCAGALAQSAPKSALLYKVTGKNLKEPSYVFGTLHLACEKDLGFTEKLGPYVARSKQVILEIDLNDSGLAGKRAGMVTLPDGKTVKDLLSPQEFAKLDAVYESYLGIPFERVQTMRPIVIATLLLMSPKIVGCIQPVMLDMAIVEVAKQTKMKITGLETAEEQWAVIDSSEEQLKSLKELGSDPEKSIAQFRALYKTYIDQDSDALHEAITKQMAPFRDAQDKMLNRRNAKWIPIIETKIKQAPTFIAVGAGHLGGKAGVVALLRARGYTMTPVKL